MNKRENIGLNHLNYSKTFIEYLNDMDDIYKNIQECNPYHMNADMFTNKKSKPIVTELLLKKRKVKK